MTSSNTNTRELQQWYYIRIVSKMSIRFVVGVDSAVPGNFVPFFYRSLYMPDPNVAINHKHRSCQVPEPTPLAPDISKQQAGKISNVRTCHVRRKTRYLRTYVHVNVPRGQGLATSTGYNCSSSVCENEKTPGVFSLRSTVQLNCVASTRRTQKPDTYACVRPIPIFPLFSWCKVQNV